MRQVDFWTAKAQNLNSIYEQLSGPKIRKVVKVSEANSDSSSSSAPILLKSIFYSHGPSNLRPAYNLTVHVFLP